MTADELPDLLTVEEAARFLRIGRTLAFQEAARFRATAGREGIPKCASAGACGCPGPSCSGASASTARPRDAGP